MYSLNRHRSSEVYDQYSSSHKDSYYWYDGNHTNNSYPYEYYGTTPVEIPQFQHPSHSLLRENGFTQQVYLKYKQECLDGMKFKVSKKISFNSLLMKTSHSIRFRTSQTWPWTINGDEYIIPVLVFFST